MTSPLLDREQVLRTRREHAAITGGITFVAFHGEKPVELRALVEFLLARVTMDAPFQEYCERGWLEPNPIERIHGTLIELDCDEQLRNVYLRRRVESSGSLAEPPPVDLGVLARYCHALPLPTSLRFGGFGPAVVNPYDDDREARRPYSRSFTVQPNGLIVVMGWPMLDATTFLPTLVGMRYAFERAGVVHKYHIKPGSIDNDFFLVLGRATDAAWKADVAERERERFLAALQAVQHAAREHLRENPVQVELGPADCKIVRYRQAGLALVERSMTAADPWHSDDLLAMYRR